MWRALKGKETFGFRWISFPLADLVILVFVLTAFLWIHSRAELENIPPFHPDLFPPGFGRGMGEPDKKPEKNHVTVNLTWDEVSQVSAYWVKRNTFTLDELKTWMYPIARSRINKETKFSEIPVHIRAPGDMPFSEIRKVLDLCRDKDIQVYMVKLDILDSGSG